MFWIRNCCYIQAHSPNAQSGSYCALLSCDFFPAAIDIICNIPDYFKHNLYLSIPIRVDIPSQASIATCSKRFPPHFRLKISSVYPVSEIHYHSLSNTLRSQSPSFCVTRRSSSRTSIRAKPNRLSPRHLNGSLASGASAGRRIPQMAS